MEYAILFAGFVLLISGLVGSILPVIPGPPLSWLGLLSLYFIPETPNEYWLLGITFALTLLISIADFLMPAYYSKRKGGSKYASWGSTLGLLIGLIFFPPLGLIVGAFLGAFLGEVIFNRQATMQQAYQSAIGAFIGFLASSLIKFMLCLSLLLIYLIKLIEFRGILF